MTPKAIEKRNADAKISLIRFFRRMFTDGETWEKFDLQHLGAVNSGAKEGMRIAGYRKDADAFKDMSPEQASEVVWDDINADRQTQDGFHRYVILRYVRDYAEPYGRQEIDVLGRITSDPDGEFSVYEPANEKGVLAMVMRHQEAFMKVSLVGAQNTINSLIDRLNRAEEMNVRMMESHFRTVAAGEEFLNQKQVRDFELRKLENREKVLEKAAEKLSPLLLALASKFILPAAPNGQSNVPDEPIDAFKQSYVIAHALIAKLTATPEIVPQCLAILSEAQQVSFMELHRIHTTTNGGVPGPDVLRMSFSFVQMILESMAQTPENAQKFVGLLNPEQKQTFLQLYAVHHAEEQRKTGGSPPQQKEKEPS